MRAVFKAFHFIPSIIPSVNIISTIVSERSRPLAFRTSPSHQSVIKKRSKSILETKLLLAMNSAIGTDYNPSTTLQTVEMRK